MGGGVSWPATAACPASGWSCGSGDAAEHVVKVAEAERADMVALAWSLQLDRGRAPVALPSVLETQVPSSWCRFPRP